MRGRDSARSGHGGWPPPTEKSPAAARHGHDGEGYVESAAITVRRAAKVEELASIVVDQCLIFELGPVTLQYF